MTRCPNCGSAIRIGAKFCTSCGFRLTTDVPASSSTGGSSRSPFSTTSSPSWRVESPVVEEPSQVASVERTVPESATSETEPTWTSVANNGDAASEPMISEAGETNTAVSESVSSGAQVNANEEPGQSRYAPATRDTTGPASDEVITSVVEMETGEAQSDDLGAHDGGDLVAAEFTQPADVASTTYGWNRDDHQIEAVQEPVAPPAMAPPVEASASVDSAPAAVESDPLAEARSLAARLTEVLATVQTGAASEIGAPVAVGTVADETDVESLRAVVKSAQERPRDVDVMLDLVLRVETIAAVIADRDVLLGAVRGDESPVEETPSPDVDDGDEPSTYPAWR